jgi:hypothetical protein
VSTLYLAVVCWKGGSLLGMSSSRAEAYVFVIGLKKKLAEAKEFDAKGFIFKMDEPVEAI